MLASLGLIWLLACTVALPSGSCSNLQRRYSNVEEANDYLDRIIMETIEENRHNLEPYRPKPANFSFEHKILIMTFRGEASLHDMTLTGLTTVHREGDCERSTTNGISKLTANLGMGVLEFDSKATVKFMDVGPTVKLSGEIGYAMIHLVASRDVEAGSLAKIEKLEIYDVKGADFKVSGLGLGIMNRIATKLTEGAAKVFKGKIMRGVEKKLKESLEEKIRDSVFPID